LSGWPRRLAALSCLLLAATSFASEHAAAARARHDAVLVATRDLPAGASLTATDVTAQPWPAGRVPATALHAPTDVVGRQLAGPVVKGEAVTANRLIGSELTLGLSAGEVAVAVQVSADVPSFVHAGDRVDLVATGQPPSSGAPVDDAAAGVSTTSRATTLAARVRVLAVLPPSGATGSDATAGLVVIASRDTATGLAAAHGEQLATLLSG
jgi:Flp pilus assembly protein CpaB